MLFRSSCPSPNSGYPFWLLALTFRSSRPAFCGRLTSPVRLNMKIFNKSSNDGAAHRLMEESLYADALREIESGIRRDGIWAKALVEANMDQSKAAAIYIKMRVQSMKDELLFSAEQEKHQQELNLPRHPSCGGIIDRLTSGSKTTWKCRKCKASGQFQIGINYKK
mgnify:CR=1 FL=1